MSDGPLSELANAAASGIAWTATQAARGAVFASRHAARHRTELLTASWSPVVLGASMPVLPHPLAYAGGGVAAAASTRSLAAGEHHRAHRMRKRVGRACLAQPKHLCRLPGDAKGEFLPPVMKLPVRTRAGWYVDIKIPDHTATEVFEQALPILETTLKAQITVEPIAEPRRKEARAAKRHARSAKPDTGVAATTKAGPRRVPRGWIRMRIRQVDVLATDSPYWPELDRIMCDDVTDAALDPRDGFTLGFDEDGERFVLNLVEKNLLIAGLMGFGKSNDLQLICAGLACSPIADLYLIDPSGGVELARWRDLAVGLADSPEQALVLLQQIQALGDRKLAEYLSEGRRALDRDDRLTFVVVDELQSLTANADAQLRNDLTRLLVDIASRHRKVGIHLVKATPRPTHDVVPTSLRDIIGYRMAHRCATSTSSDVILGDKWAARGFDAADSGLFPDDVKGLALVITGGAAPRRIRIPYLSDTALDRIHDRALEIRAAHARVVRPAKAASSVLASVDPWGDDEAPKASAVEPESKPAVDPNARRLAAAKARAQKRPAGRRRRPPSSERRNQRAIAAQDQRATGWTPESDGGAS